MASAKPSVPKPLWLLMTMPFNLRNTPPSGGFNCFERLRAARSTRSPNPASSESQMQYRRPAGVRARRGGDRITTLFAALHEPVTGTFETSRDVRSSVAIRGKADVTRTLHLGSD